MALRVLVLTLAALGLSAADPAGTWPQWRGPQRTGVAPGPSWPEKFDGLTPLWRVDLDKGYPSPIVSEDKVFVAETANTDTELVRALDRKTGKEIWRASWPGKISVPFFAKKNGDWIRSTPAWDGKTLFVGGMEEVLVALDGKTGKEKWRVDFPAKYNNKKPEFGFSSSPLVDGEFLYIQAADSVIKLNKNTGETVWRALEHKGTIMDTGAFSSPALATVAGRPQLLIQSRTHLSGLDPKTGKVYWSQEIPSFRGMHIVTPTVYKDSVFTSVYRVDSYLFKLTPEGESFTVSEAWKNKSKGYMSTPVIIGDYAYLHLMSQRFTCIDLRNGETKWTTEPYGTYWSMAVRGDKILALDERGQLLLIRANPEKFELLDQREIAKTSTWGHIAIAGNELFIRELNGIAAYRWTAAPAAVTSSGAY